MAINTDDLVDDFVNNLNVVIDNNRDLLQLKEIYTEDILLVSAFPSVAITCSSLFIDLRTVGSSQVRYTFSFMGELWYYHDNFGSGAGKNEIMRRAVSLSKIILENGSLNGWLVNSRAEIRSCAYTPRIRGTSVMASARIIVVAPYLQTINIV